MAPHDRSAGSDSIDGRLDAGLRAAFGLSDETVGHRSALATIEESIGPCTRVLLRDEEEEPAPPVVRPLARDLLATGFDSRRYTVLGELARGGMGLVLLSRDGDLGRDVAMKVLRDEHIHDPGMVRRFVEEAQIAGQLQHPGILPVYELGVAAAGAPYFTMKLVKGRTLAAVLRDRRDPPSP